MGKAFTARLSAKKHHSDLTKPSSKSKPDASKPKVAKKKTFVKSKTKSSQTAKTTSSASSLVISHYGPLSVAVHHKNNHQQQQQQQQQQHKSVASRPADSKRKIENRATATSFAKKKKQEGRASVSSLVRQGVANIRAQRESLIWPTKKKEKRKYQAPVQPQVYYSPTLLPPRDTCVKAVVPWLEHGATAATVSSTPGQYGWLREITAGAWDTIDAELGQFSRYVSLSNDERWLRNEFVRQVENTVATVFHKRSEQETESLVQVFGSFATREVCCFYSDVDMAVWGLLKDHNKNRSIAVGKQKNQKRKRDDAAQKAFEQELKKKERLNRWMTALDTVTDENIATPKTATVASSQKTITVVASSITETSKATFDSTNRKESSMKMASKNETRVESNMVDLFVIDRSGNNEPVADTTEHLILTNNANTFAEIIDLTGLDDDDCAQENELIGSTTKTKVPVESKTAEYNFNKNIATALLSNSAAADSETESDMDIADKLETWKGMKFGDTAATDRHFVSLSSSSSSFTTTRMNEDFDQFCVDDDFDSDGGHDDDDDDDNTVLSQLKVSFITENKNQATTFGPRGRVKRECVDALKRLQIGMRRTASTSSSQLISAARVPIVKFRTKTGFEADVAVGGHNGADTSRYAAKQVAKHKSFSVVILFLKVLLAQQNLDQPFTGGIGSYKLYVMLAYHLQEHLELGGSDRPGEVLLGFFFRYGSISTNSRSTRLVTILSQDSELTTSDGGTADFSNVHLLDRCVILFEHCFRRLKTELLSNNRKASVTTMSSLLCHLVQADRLHRDRSKHLQTASAEVRRINGSMPELSAERNVACNNVIGNFRNECLKKISMALSAPRKEHASDRNSKHRDLTASELVSGYVQPERPAKRARR